MTRLVQESVSFVYADHREQWIDEDSPIVNLKEAGVELPSDAEQIWASPNYSRHTTTDHDGRFELFVGPGKYDLRGTAQNEILNFEITNETEREFNFHSWRPRCPSSGTSRPATRERYAAPSPMPIRRRRFRCRSRCSKASSIRLSGFPVIWSEFAERPLGTSASWSQNLFPILK